MLREQSPVKVFCIATAYVGPLHQEHQNVKKRTKMLQNVAGKIVFDFKEHTEVVVLICEILVFAKILGKMGRFSARFKSLGGFLFISL